MKRSNQVELADGITPQDIKLFLTETDEQLQLLDEDIVRLERESDNVKLLQEIFRASHTIKGSSAMIRHQRMSHLAHGMENVLDKVRKGALAVSSPVVDALLKGLDGLRILKEELVTGQESTADINIILLELEAAMSSDETNPKARVQNSENASLDNESKIKLEEALSKGERAYRVKVVVNKVTTWVSVRCFQVAQELAKIATVIKSNPSLSEIESGNAGSTIEVLIATVKDEKTINDTVASIPEIDNITVSPYIVEEAGVTGKEKTASNDPTSIKKEDTGLRQSIRVDVSRLDTLMEQIGELVINRNHIGQIGKTLAEKYQEDELIRTLNDSLSQTGKFVNILQQDIMTIRMLPIELVFNTMPRMVRDLARKTGKKVDFIVEGQESEEKYRTIFDSTNDVIILLDTDGKILDTAIPAGTGAR
jgi:two-component system chemotaxis sensor kinase CheA